MTNSGPMSGPRTLVVVNSGIFLVFVCSLTKPKPALRAVTYRAGP